MHILIVEDEQRLARLIKRVLTEERHVADAAYDGAEGLTLALTGSFDLIILVLMLTARGAVEDRVTGLRAGADDYLVKPFAMAELLARVDALLRRGRALNEMTQLKVGDLSLDLTRHEATRGERVIELTAKEFALLEYLMRHPGQALTRTQILDHVWRYDADAISNVVDIYIHYLRDKIDRGFQHPLIKTIRGVGYR